MIRLVGNVTEAQLRFVEVFPATHFGVFVPVLGQCGYAIEKGHSHPAWMVVVSAAEVPVHGVPTRPAPPGFHLRIMAPGVPHQERPSHEPHRYYAIMIEPPWFESAARELAIDVHRFGWEAYPASDRLLALIRDFMGAHDQHCPRTVLDALAWLTVHELLRCTQPVACKPVAIAPHASLHAVMDALEQHFGRDWKLAELAQLAGMSTSTLQRAFKASLHCSPMAYLLQIRMRRAQHLLRCGTSISSAARATGFTSVSHFSEAFVRFVKLTPAQYKKRHLASP